MKNDLQAGLQNIIDAINNLIEPKLGSLRYDKTFRAKVISDEGNNVYGVQINGKNYKAVYTGEKIPVGQIVKVKAPLNNFSDIYIETLPGSGGGSAGNYNNLLNKPILNTNNTGTQVPSATEIIQGTISLHKVSKTGNYNDLLNKPTLDFIPTSEKGAANGVAGLDENKRVSKSNLPTDTVYDSNYVHTDNNFTTAMKDKLDSVEEGAEPNKIEIIQRNNAVLPITNKTVNIEVPTKTSDLTNDSGFINSIPIASDTILGGIKVGDNLSITADGVLSASGGGTTDYSVLLNKPVLNTANTKSLAVDSNETINGVVSLHKISKTGSYEDLLNKPTIPTKTSNLTNNGDGTTGSKYITNSSLNIELENKQDKITGGATTIVTNDLTVNRALVSNANGKVAVSSTTSTELGYLSGARSNLQTQIDTITTEGGQPNVIEVVQENGIPLEITNKTVNVIVPTKVSELENDKNYLTEIPIASATVLGGIKIGSNLTITEDGTLSAEAGGVSSYNGLTDKPTLNTNITTSQPVSESETITGEMVLHKISKTGNYNDLNNKLNIANGDATGSLRTTYVSSSYVGEHSFSENGFALGNFSHAEGSSMVGRKTFTIVSEDSTAKTYTLNSVSRLKIGMPYSIRSESSYTYRNQGTITAIDTDTNTITVSYYRDIGGDNKYLFIDNKPDIGVDFYPYNNSEADFSHAEGYETYASGDSTHSEGRLTYAIGDYSHAEGEGTNAYANYSHAEGSNTIANGIYQHVQGKYNIADTTSLDIIGNGTDNDNRSNAYTLDTNGNGWFSGEVYVGSTSGTNKDSGSVRLAKISELDTKVDKTTTIAGINLQGNITVAELVDALKIEMLKIENPVGHIRMETTDTNPATYLGFGTWVLWGSGRVPVGVDKSDTSFNTVEKTGGAKTVNTLHSHIIASHNHGGNTGSTTLTINQIPAHTHDIWQTSGGSTQSAYANSLSGGTVWRNNLRNVPDFSKSKGGGEGHWHTIASSGQQTTSTVGNGFFSLLQPYITCYMWKRTA